MNIIEPVNKKPMIYIAGPYTNPDPVVNTRNAILAGMDLYDTGKVSILIPHVTMLTHMVVPRDLDFWYQFDLDQMTHCHAILRIPGESTGADAEVAEAIKQGIPVFYDKDLLMAWVDEQAEAE